MEPKEEAGKVTLTPEEIQKRTIEFSKILIEHVKKEAEKLEQPAPVAVILNSLMYIYLSVVLNTIPQDMRKDVIKDHFERVLKDVEDAIQSDRTIKTVEIQDQQ